MKTLLIKPHLTEKSMLAASRGVYTFVVASLATKHEVKALVQELFKVSVTKVTSTTIQQPPRRTGKKRLATSVSPLKLARVWLKEGQSIALFDLKEDK